ncbi:hypothetical protein [Streptomyces sp. NPDC048636]|uniref:hypothetical protein n=1 Tax=Streptomyces sp. NPDC048636 TaxID=3155762 RepID=UPI003432E91E
MPDLTTDPAPWPAAGPSPDAAQPPESAERAEDTVPGTSEGGELPRPPEDAPPAEAPGPAAPAPLGVPRTPTGVAEVDARLDRLADADHLGTGEHLEVYEDVHQGLRDTLTALDRRPGPPAPAPHGPA